MKKIFYNNQKKCYSNLFICHFYKLTLLCLLFIFSSSKMQAAVGECLNLTSGDYIDFGTTLGNFGTSNFTIETWFKTSATVDQSIISKRGVCAHANFWNLRMIPTGELFFEVDENSPGLNYFSLQTPDNYNDNVWHHVAVVRTGVTLRIQMDGYTVATTTTAATTNLSNTTALRLGQNICVPFIGWLDETRIWSTNRSQCLVCNNRFIQLTTATSLILNCNYNQGTANGTNAGITALNDASTSNNDGNLMTFALTGSTSNWTNNGCPAQGNTTAPAIGTTTATACTSYVWNGTTYTSSGTYTSTFASANGCDSLSTLELTLATPVSGGNQTGCLGDTLKPEAYTRYNPLLDQSNITGGIIVNGNSHWQSFTPAVNGSLNALEIEMRSPLSSGSTAVQISIYDGEGTGGTLLGTSALVTVTSTTTYSFINFDLSSLNIYLNQGQQYTVRLNTASFDQGWFRYSNANPYPGGMLNGNTSLDLRFKTYMSEIKWYNVSSGGTAVANPSKATVGSSTFYAEVQAGACVSNRTAVTLTLGPSISIAGGGSVCNGSAITLTASGANTYVWMPGSITTAIATFSPTSTTTYTLTGTDANGCTATATKTITVNSLPTVNISGATIRCTAAPMGLIVSGAVTYVWNPGNITGGTYTVSPIVTTTYTVIGTNASGCTNTDTHTITVPPTTTLSITGGNVNVCLGESATLVASGMVSYQWSSPLNVSGSTVTVSPTTTTAYTVTGTDANSCTKISSVTLNVIAKPNLTVNAMATNICPGQSTTLTVSGAVSYVWMPGNLTGSTQTLSPSVTTTYTITGTGSNGCTKAINPVITVLPNTLVIPNLVNTDPSICAGDSVTSFIYIPSNLAYCIPSTPGSGSQIVSVTFNGGQMYNAPTYNSSYEYFPNKVIEAQAGTNYGISVTATNGYPRKVWMDVNQDGDFTDAGELLVTMAYQFGFNYNITIPATAINGITRMRIGTHAFISDAGLQSCSLTGSMGEYEDYPVVVTGGVSNNLSYAWSPSSFTASTEDHYIKLTEPTASTNYQVIITNGTACASKNESFTVNPLPTVTVNASINPLCLGSSSVLTASSASTYTWMPGSLTGSSVTVSPTATTTYTVTGTSSSGCTASTTILLTVLPNILNMPAIIATDPSICANETNTLAHMYVPSNLTYCNPTFGTFGALYWITKVDFNSGAMINTSGYGNNVFYATKVIPMIAGNPYNITINDIGGNSRDKKIWVDLNQDGDFTDAGELIASASANTLSITIPISSKNGTTRLRIGISSSSTPLNACGTGSFQGEYEDYPVVISNGTANSLSFAWSPNNFISNATNSIISISNPTATITYSVTISDGVSCAVKSSTETILPIPVLSSTTSVHPICAGLPTTITASGANSYSWTGGITNGVSFTKTATTTFTVTGTDANGCTNTLSTTLNVNALPSVGSTASTTTVCIGTATTLNGTGANSYTWTGGVSNGVAFSPTTTTTYTVTGTNTATGCTKTATQVITVNPLPNVTASATATTLCAGASTTITAANANTYSWQPGGSATNPLVVSPATTTTYTVTGTDINECSKTATRSITVNPLPIVTANATLNSVCAGVATTLFGGGATSYLWTGGISNNVSFIPTATTTYMVTGTNANGCTNTNTKTIVVNALPNVTISASANPTCVGNPSTLTASGASTLTWNNGIINATAFTPMATNIYIVTGTDANACTKTSSITLVVNPCGNANAINVKLFLQGFYTSSTMTTALMNSGVGASTNDVDSVTVELKGYASPYNTISSSVGILQTNGNVSTSFTPVPFGYYYIVIRHRNSVETWSVNPVLIKSNTSYDFTISASQAYGDNQVEVEPNVWAIYTGDMDQDGGVDNADFSFWEIDANNFAMGYVSTDIDGNGAVDNGDFSIWEINSTNFVGVIKP
jgi:hypothetical protein